MAGVRRALLIATSTYADAGFGRLRAPNADATGLQRVLADPAIGGYQVEILRDPAHQDAMLAVEDLYADAGADDLVLLYVSGHGVKDDDRLYLAMTNSRLDRLSSTAMPVTFVHDRMADSRSRAVVVWLDCCFSGSLPRGYLVRAAERHANVKEQLLQGGGAANAFADDESRGYAVMTSSTALQHPFEPDGEAAPSLFTRHLIAGLRTGDADRDRDGAVDVGELYQYVFDQLRGGPGRQQPTLYSRVAGKLHVANNPNPRVEPAAVAEPESSARRWWPIGIGIIAVVVIGIAAAIAAPYLRDRFSAAPEIDPPVVLQHTSDIGDVSISPDGALVATASGRTGGADQGGQAQLWDARSGRRVAEFTDPDRVQAVQFSPDGTLLASGTWEDVVRLYDVAGRTEVGVLAGHGAHITGVAFSSDGRLLASTGADEQVRVWDVQAQHEITTFTPDQQCSSPAFSADAGLLVATCESGVWVWDMSRRAQVAVIGGRGNEVIAFDRAGSLVFSDELGGVLTWDPERQDRIPLLPPRSVRNTGDVALDPGDARTLAASTSEADVQVWDTRQQRVVSTLTGHTGAIGVVEFSADGGLLATASADRTVRVWPLAP